MLVSFLRFSVSLPRRQEEGDHRRLLLRHLGQTQRNSLQKIQLDFRITSDLHRFGTSVWPRPTENRPVSKIELSYSITRREKKRILPFHFFSPGLNWQYHDGNDKSIVVMSQLRFILHFSSYPSTALFHFPLCLL